MKLSWTLGAVCVGLCASVRAEPAPRSLDAALTDTLSLGNAAGCGPTFGLPDLGDQTELDTLVAGLRDSGQLGQELAMICGSSAVSSSSSLGGSLGSVQTTKTVSQFRLARSRADSRLNERGKRVGADAPVLLAQLGDRPPTTTTSTADAESGTGAFVQASGERRDRVTTALEAGYRADIADLLVGIDHATRDLWLFGGWLGYRRADADYRHPRALIGSFAPDFGDSLTPAVQAEICKLDPGGGFDDKGLRLGGFVAKRFGDAFADVAVQYSRRNYAYRRNVCAIEASSDALVPDPGSPSGFSSGGVPVDDVYAGTISGKARLTEWGVSARAGFDLRGERWHWGPRLSLTYLRTTLGAYIESGRTSVTHRVESNTNNVLFLDRAAGDPTGLELAFERQRRASLLSELQLVAAYRVDTEAGTVVPRIAASWLHEFKADRDAVRMHMAQDRRADAVRLSFTTDRVDRNKGSVGVGVSWAHPSGWTAEADLVRLVGDDRFDSTQLSLQALWRF